ATDQTIAVPAQVMHFRKPRRSISPGPVVVSSLIEELPLATDRRPVLVACSTVRKAGLFRGAVWNRMASRAVWDVATGIRTNPLPTDDRRRRFELLALPHLDAAFNLARW